MSESQEVYLNYKEAAAHLSGLGLQNCSQHTVKKWALNGTLPFIRSDAFRFRVIAKSALNRWLEQRQREAERESMQRQSALSKRRPR